MFKFFKRKSEAIITIEREDQNKTAIEKIIQPMPVIRSYLDNHNNAISSDPDIKQKLEANKNIVLDIINRLSDETEKQAYVNKLQAELNITTTEDFKNFTALLRPTGIWPQQPAAVKKPAPTFYPGKEGVNDTADEELAADIRRKELMLEINNTKKLLDALENFSANDSDIEKAKAELFGQDKKLEKFISKLITISNNQAKPSALLGDLVKRANTHLDAHQKLSKRQ